MAKVQREYQVTGGLVRPIGRSAAYPNFTEAMKQPVQPITPEKLLRGYPITDLVQGWFFRLEEISSGMYRAEGSDEYGRQVACSGHAADGLLSRCADDTLLMGPPASSSKTRSTSTDAG